MAIEHREAGRGEFVEPGDDNPASPPRRFARLATMAAPRRLSRRGVVQAIVACLLGVVGLGFGGERLSRALASWVSSLPEYQIPFSRIELVPEPPPYIRGGTPGFLERVRSESGHEDQETLPLLSANLDDLVADFKRSPWVKGVSRVERTAGRLAVHLAYRTPIALAEFEKGRALVIDEEGVILPCEDRDTAWVAKDPDYRLRGIEQPLIVIRGVDRPIGTLSGLQWKRSDGLTDERILGAARLAYFLQSRDKKAPGGRDMPRFKLIVPELETLRYYLYDAEKHRVFWGEAPSPKGLERPRAESKWAMLGRWIDERGSLPSGPGEYLMFDHAGPRVGRPVRSARATVKPGD